VAGDPAPCIEAILAATAAVVDDASSLGGQLIKCLGREVRILLTSLSGRVERRFLLFGIFPLSLSLGFSHFD
jgi:hypothetical protein